MMGDGAAATTVTTAATATATTATAAGLRGVRYGGYIGPERLRVVNQPSGSAAASHGIELAQGEVLALWGWGYQYRRCWRLQPYAPEAVTIGDKGFNHMRQRLQP